MQLNELVIGVKGAGEQATGTAWRLYQSNFPKIFMMERQAPLAIRRHVAFSEAVFEGSKMVESVEAHIAGNSQSVVRRWQEGKIAVVVDPYWEYVRDLKPHVLIDATIAKKNLGTAMTDAPLVIGMGPGFTADKTAHMVIETNRGHHLGRVITQGTAQADTGIPGTIEGFSKERLVRAPCSGRFVATLDIGSMINCGDVVGFVDKMPVTAQLTGVVRGLIRSGTQVGKGLKIGDIDPRGEISFCTTISEKSRAIAGGVIEAILRVYNGREGGL